MKQETQNNNTTKISWYLTMPILVILFFIFPPISSVFSVIMFIKRWKISDSNGKKKMSAVLAVMCFVFVAFAIYGAVCTISGNEKLNKINAAIDSGNYIVAKQLIDEEYKNQHVSYSVVTAKARMYEQQGLYDEAGEYVLEYWEKKDDKSEMSDSTVGRLEGYRDNCNDETVKKFDSLLEVRRIAIEQKTAEEQAKVTSKQAAKDAKAQARAEKAAAKAQAKAEKTAAKQAAKETKTQAKAEKAAAEQAAKDSKEQVQSPTEKPTENTVQETPAITETTAPTKTTQIGENYNSDVNITNIQNKEQALDIYKSYIVQNNLPQYNICKVSEKNDYFSIYAYFKEEEQSGAFFYVNKNGGMWNQ